jgi:hypothetical protein
MIRLIIAGILFASAASGQLFQNKVDVDQVKSRNGNSFLLVSKSTGKDTSEYITPWRFTGISFRAAHAADIDSLDLRLIAWVGNDQILVAKDSIDVTTKGYKIWQIEVPISKRLLFTAKALSSSNGSQAKLDSISLNRQW